MKELTAILAEWSRLVAEGSDGRAALATVVQTEGSTYRRPGARMLVLPDGSTVGTLSGGCLEGDAAEHARAVVETGAPKLVRYDTSSGDDLVWGLGLGCNGVVYVLIEPLATAAVREHLASARAWLASRESGVVATAFRVDGESPVAAGTRARLGRGEPPPAGAGAEALAAMVAADAEAALRSGRSAARSYALPSGRADVLVEVVEPPMPLVVAGAGHDAIPVVRLAKELGWHVTVVDHRPAFAARDRFPGADEIVVARPEDAAGRVRIDDRTAAVLMTHNYAHDLELLAWLLPSPARYVGALGPKSRADRLLRDLAERGVRPSERELARLHAPVGIDIGADSPEEIALAIVAEARAVAAARGGGPLRDRRGPIHGRGDSRGLGSAVNVHEVPSACRAETAKRSDASV